MHKMVQPESPRLLKSLSTGSSSRNGPGPAPLPEPPSPPTGNSGIASKNDLRRETEDAINCILPPKEWTEDGETWRQQVSLIQLISINIFIFILYLKKLHLKVSSTPATRLDVLALQEQLDLRLKQRQARDIGICPIRRELYSQCFGI